MFLKAIFPGHKSDVQSKAIHAVDHFWQILKQQHHEKTDGGDTGGASRIGIPSIAGNASITGCFAMDVELDKKLRIARGGDKGRNNCFAMDMELDRRLRIARGGDKGRNNIVPIGPDNVRKLEIAGGKFCDRMPPVTGGRYGTVRIHFKSLQYDVILPVDEFHLFRCFAMDIELDRRLRFARGGVKGRNNIVPIGPDNVRKLEIAGGKFCDRTPPVTGGRYGTIRIHFKSLQYDVILPVDEFHLFRCRWLNDYFENNPRCKKSFKPYFQCECDGYPSHPGLDPCFDCASFQRQRNCGKKAAVSEVLELEECGSASAIPTEQDTTQGRRRKKVNAGVKTKSQRGKAEGSRWWTAGKLIRSIVDY